MKFVLTFEKIDGEFCDRECPLFALDAETDIPLCSLTSEKVVENELRPEWCPLIECPEKMSVDIDDELDYMTPEEKTVSKRIIKNSEHFHNGWNACLDEICGKDE